MSASNKFQQLSDAFLKISQGFAEVASIMNNNLEPIVLRNEVINETASGFDNKVESTESSSALIQQQQPPTKKVKKERDPNQPKKPLNNYFLFQRDFRARCKESHPTATFPEITKMMNEAWEKMSKEETEYYDNLAKEHYAAYLTAFQEYTKKKEESEIESAIESIIAEGINSESSNNNETTPMIPIAQGISSSEAETPKKKKKKNKEKRSE